LADQLKARVGIQPIYPVDANAVFIILPARVIAALEKGVDFHVWDKARGLIRLMCSWQTTEEEIKSLVERIDQELAAAN